MFPVFPSMRFQAPREREYKKPQFFCIKILRHRATEPQCKLGLKVLWKSLSLSSPKQGIPPSCCRVLNFSKEAHVAPCLLTESNWTFDAIELNKYILPLTFSFPGNSLVVSYTECYSAVDIHLLVTFYWFHQEG